MKKTLIIAMLASIALMPLAAQSGRISVSGSAEISAYPDIAEFTVTATATKNTTEEARIAVSSMTNEAAGILKSEFGVAEEDITTSMISAYPEYRWTEDGNELIGQRANESISVVIRDIEDLGDIYTRLLGINGIEISNVSLDKEDKSVEIEESRIAAVMDARTKAETYARAAGVRIGDVVSITDSSSSSVIYPRIVMYAMAAIENVSRYLARAVADGNDLEAHEHVAFGNTMSGIVMNIASCTAEHSLEHAMSAYHHELPHGAGLIMISKAFYEYFIERHACDERFVRMAQAMGMAGADKPEDFITMLVRLQEACGVADLKMSDYGIRPDEFDTLARNARETMGGLFLGNPCELDHVGCVEILRKSYK